jgi:hypothetical protein
VETSCESHPQEKGEMSVKRYEPCEFADHTGMQEYEFGNYIDASDYDSLRAQLEKVEIEKGALQVAYDDLRGKLIGQCGQCNMLERADCYRRQDTAYQRGAREMRERAAAVIENYPTVIQRFILLDVANRVSALPDTLPTGPSESTKV